MLDCQKITDEIQSVLAAASDHSHEAIAAVHRDYLEAVREVNARLGVCRDLLARGQRSEAIRQCNAEPNLLDAVAILDFPDRTSWCDLLARQRLPRPPDLLIDAAADLNDAYTAEQPIERLLRNHRLLALARAPLPRRIQTLRAIRAADPENPIWERDLRDYENARLHELRCEMQAAVQAQDLGCLATLEQEVRARDWVEPVPQDLARRIIQAHGEVRQRAARQELGRLAGELNQAFSSFDLSRGRELRTRWNAAAAIGLTSDADELLEMAGPALEWLQQEDQQVQAGRQRESAVAALERTLEDFVEYHELERAWHAVRRSGGEIPVALQRRVAERFRYLEEASTRRHRFALAAIVLLVLAASAAIGLGVVRHLRARQVEEHAARMGSLVTGGELVQAQQYAENLQQSAPDICSEPEIQECLARIRKAVVEDQGRRARLTTCLDAVQARDASEPSWDSLAAAWQDLEEGKKLAKSDEELARVKTLELRISERRRQMQKAVDDRFLKDLTSLEADFSRVERTDLNEIAVLMARARQLQKQPHVSAELLGPIEPLIARLNAYRQAEADRDRERRQLERFTND